MRIKLLTTAALVVTAGLPADSLAQCILPEDAVVIVCTGVDDDGVVIDDEAVIGLDVREGAVVRSDDTAVLFLRGDPQEPFALTQIDGRIEAGVLGIELGGVPTNRTSLIISKTGSVDSDGSTVSVGTVLESVVNEGVITARDGFGVSLGGLDDGFAVLNSQSFVNRGSVTATGAALAASFNTTVSNAGTVVSTGPGGVGASAGDVADVGNSGTISGEVGVRIGSGTLSNSGTIEGTGGTAIAFGDGGVSLTVVGGRIVGDVLGGEGGDVVTLSGGEVRGDVLLGDGDDVFAYEGGVVDGLIDLGEGEDRVELAFGTDDLAGVVIGDALATAELTFDAGAGGSVLSFAGAELFAFRDRTLSLAELAALSEVPLPGAAMLFLSGLGLAGLRRRAA